MEQTLRCPVSPEGKGEGGSAGALHPPGGGRTFLGIAFLIHYFHFCMYSFLLLRLILFFLFPTLDT